MATLDGLRGRQSEIRARLEEIDSEAAGERFTEAQKEEWNALNEELELNREHITELEARVDRLADLGAKDNNRETELSLNRRGMRNDSKVPADPTDLMSYRNTATSIDQLQDTYLEGALRLNERMIPAIPGADREDSQERVEQLLRTVDDPESRVFARRVIATSSNTYSRAFGKYIMGGHRTSEEERALSLTTTAGGYAVPYTLDPTVINVGAGYVNPMRRLCRIETITGNNWIGVTSTGVSASYSAEVTETSDNAPTLVQPSLNVEKAQAFIPFSIEISGDWPALQMEMGRLFADAKNKLENTKFALGLGHTSSEPQGLVSVGGATSVYVTATTAVFAVADLYGVETQLDPRWRPNASIVANRAVFNKIRQFDTAGGASLWVQLQYNEPATLIGYPAYEWSALSSGVTTSGSTVLTIGDFSQFLIVDRVGMDVELIPHLFATANNRPSGQRGLYCYWRNSSLPLTPSLTANSAFQSVKIL